MDNPHLFSTRGSSYELARPGYPEALIDYLYGELHFAQAGAIADIGSGTGKFSRQLLVRGSRVYCVEPNDEMRRIAEQKLQGYAGFISLNGTASDTGIMEPVDAVTAAQAFHWFDRDEFRDECRRILKPGGRVCLIWNLRVPNSPITEECRSVFRQYCPRFKDFNIGMREDSPEIYEFFGGREHCDKAVFDNPLRYDEKRFVERYLSSSYSLREGDPGYEESIRRVREIFTCYARDGEVEVPNQAICYSGTLSRNNKEQKGCSWK